LIRLISNRPRELLTSPLDFPNQYHADSAFFFSGHIAFFSLITTLKYRNEIQSRISAKTTALMTFISAVAMLATRGHYSIDMAVGAGAGWAMACTSEFWDVIATGVSLRVVEMYNTTIPQSEGNNKEELERILPGNAVS
jgi:hypothetical protein